MPIESKFQSVKHVAFAMRLHAVIWFATKIQNNQRKCRRAGLNANLCATTFDTAYKMTWSTCHVNVIEYESEKENFWAFSKINIIKTTANSMRKKTSHPYTSEKTSLIQKFRKSICSSRAICLELHMPHCTGNSRVSH